MKLSGIRVILLYMFNYEIAKLIYENEYAKNRTLTQLELTYGILHIKLMR